MDSGFRIQCGMTRTVREDARATVGWVVTVKLTKPSNGQTNHSLPLRSLSSRTRGQGDKTVKRTNRQN